MKKIDINITKTRNTNYQLPPIASSLSAEKRSVNLLKWRIAQEILNRRNISKRLNGVVKELEEIEKKLDSIYSLTDNAVHQFINTEKTLNKNASEFL